MTQSIFDGKLKRFIELSLEGNQIRAATNLLYNLVSNMVDEIGYKLGFAPRRKEHNEKLSEYITLINKVFHYNFELIIFIDSQITTIKIVEALFERKKLDEEFPQSYLKELTQLYFDLQKIRIPNLQEHLKDSDIMENRTISLMSFLSHKNQYSSTHKSSIKPLLLHLIHQDQKRLLAQLQEELDQDAILRLIQLKSIEKSLMSQSKWKKIHLSGNLLNNVDFSLLTSKTSQFGIQGIIFAFLILAIVCVAEMILFGIVTNEIGGLLLLCVLMVLILSYINKKWLSNPR
jgi:hypothetical protein